MTAERKSLQTSIFIARTHPHFEGHFPLASVFPGVSQIDLVLGLAREHWGKDLRCAMVKRAKYRAIIKPDSRVELSITLTGAEELSWVLRDEVQIFSTGDLRLMAPALSAS